MQYKVITLALGLFSLFANTKYISAKESVPVLIWKNENPPIDIPAISPLQIPFSHLEEKYLQQFQPENILLFLQDTLSIEDLSSYENVFKNIRESMDDNHSLYLPAVEAKTSIAHTLSVHGYNMITLEPGSSAGEIIRKKNSKNLVVVKLPSTTTNPSRKLALQKSDEVIHNVLSKLGKEANFTMIFTGKGPSVKLENEVEHRRVSRSLKQSQAGKDAHFHKTDCVILYLKNDIVLEMNNKSFTLMNNDTQTDIGDCKNGTVAIVIQYKEPLPLNKAKLQFSFVKLRRSWTMQGASITLMETSDSTPVYITYKPEWPMAHVPLQKSYSCSQKLVLRSNVTDGLKSVSRIIINGVQIQAFIPTTQTAFSDNWDCIGFFTIPIWMGIFAGVVLTLILLIGMFMLSEIKTMDRFDDPKGKHLMVAGATTE